MKKEIDGLDGSIIICRYLVDNNHGFSQPLPEVDRVYEVGMDKSVQKAKQASLQLYNKYVRVGKKNVKNKLKSGAETISKRLS